MFHYINVDFWNYGLFWYPFITFTPGFCILISLIARKLGKYRFCNLCISIFSKLGKYTFEIYLTHILIFNIFSKLLGNIDNFMKLITVILIIPMVILLYNINRIIQKYLKRKLFI